MRKYAVLYKTNNNGYYPVLGTDGTIYVDGRFTLENNINEVKQHIHRIRNVTPGITKFEIWSGELNRPNNKLIYSATLNGSTWVAR